MQIKKNIHIHLDLSDDDEIQAQPTAKFMQDHSYDEQDDDLNDLQIDLDNEKVKTKKQELKNTVNIYDRKKEAHVPMIPV